MISDEFRTIRTNLKFLMEDQKNRIFLVTSPNSEEGKSTIIANLAVSLAQQKDKVLLMDANLRDPVIHQVFKTSNQSGLADILKNKASLQQAITLTDIAHLDLLTSGSDVSNPTELLGSKEMEMLLEEVTSLYDIVLIDSPAILKFTETRVLANKCEGTVLVLNRGRTEMKKVYETKRVLDLAQVNLMGFIFNEI